MIKKLTLCASLVLLASFMLGCATGPRVVDTYVFDSGPLATKTTGGVTISVQYVATDSWDSILKDTDLVKMLTAPKDKVDVKIQELGLAPYKYAIFPYQYGDKYYFFPITAGLNAYKVKITNNTPGVIRVKDLRAGFLTPDGEKFNSLGKQALFDFINDSAEAEIHKQQKALSSNWSKYMDMFIGLCMTKFNMNKYFQVLNDPDAEIVPGQTYACFAFFDGGISYAPGKASPSFMDTAKLGIYEVPVEVDQANTVVKRSEFVFDVKKTSIEIGGKK